MPFVGPVKRSLASAILFPHTSIRCAQATESSRLYVVTLENACPQWWQFMSDCNDSKKVLGKNVPTLGALD
eukprot:7067631-Pyramimonas_sp.AAC.1